MTRHAALVMLPLVLFTACDNKNADETHRGTTSGQGTNANSPAVDDTRINDRDKAGATTPIDQGNNPADLDTTQQIRKALMSDDSLSTDAKNVKVITNGGVVTLRGPVKNEQERRTIEAKARQLAGKNQVDDRLDVESKAINRQ